jgi:hypothetical protein
MAGLSSDGWDAVDEWQQLSHIVTIRTGQNCVQRNAIRIRKHMVFTYRCASICGIWTCFFAPAVGSHRAAVHGGTRPINPTSLTQLIQ